MRLQTVLITGGAGFVGSSLALALKRRYASMTVMVMDNLRRRGSELNIMRLKEHGIGFYHGDIRNKEDFAELPAVQVVIEASAEPSVLAGLNGAPEYVINTNLIGAINCFIHKILATLHESYAREYKVNPVISKLRKPCHSN